jgi:selenocysteine-specific elongation factor
MPTRRLILGTAGHVDHGKTELVSRLTGWDTDRLKEEKERGISIELGFAPLYLDDDTMIGVVDVPGHEKFVKHMVAGAGGIDLAMLVIAADESVMPQTKEHLEVLTALDITSGVVVVTKTDIASEDMIEIVKDEAAELVEGTFLEGAPVVETSAKTDEGIDELKKTLLSLALQVKERDTAGPFRLAIDRVFHIQGIGVVITGSGYSGTVTVGDSLELLPAKKAVRIREIQSFGGKRNEGYAGERLAIALQGVKLDEVSRGDMLVTPSAFVVSYIFDARVHIADYTQFEVKHRERVRIHHGAREVLGRAQLIESSELRSGENALVQIRLETPIVGHNGDLFVLRKYSPTMVLGGGRIIDPTARRHRRRDAAVIERLRLLEKGDPKDQLLQTVETAGLRGVNKKDHDPDIAQALVDDERIAVIDGVLFHTQVLADLAGRVESLAADYVKKHPLRYGIDKEELKQKVRFPQPTPLFNSVLEAIAGTHPIYIKDNRVRTGSKDITLPKEVSDDITMLEIEIKKPGLLFSKPSELERAWRGKSAFADALGLLVEDRRIVKIGSDGYVHHDALKACLTKLSDWYETNNDLTVGDFKEMSGITRKHAIPLLEHFDQARVTVRDGNVRRRGPRLNDFFE